MAMKVSREEFLGITEPLRPSFENVAAKIALDFEADVFLRLKELGLKQKDLAQLLGVSPAAVSKLLSENSNMTLKTMAKIAAALGCEISPIHLDSVTEVSYADLEVSRDTETVLVSYEMVFVSNMNDSIENQSSISYSVQPLESAESVPDVVFRRIAA